MAEATKIEWTTHTFNPWVGCVEVSPGCDHCYARTLAKRTGHEVWGAHAPRWFMGEEYWKKPLRWNAAAEKRGERDAVFCLSMGDWAEVLPESHPSREAMYVARLRLWALIEETPWLDWLLLTKRIGNAEKVLPVRWVHGGWPANVRIGISVVNQPEADRDVPKLLRLGCRTFVSYEPALGPVDWTRIDYHTGYGCGWTNALTGRRTSLTPGTPLSADPWKDGPKIDWLIVGGESGPGARPFDVAWARETVRQCREAGVPVFVKQLGARPWWNGTGRPPADHVYLQPDVELNGAIGWRLDCLRDRKGGDMSEWPEDLRVREVPR